MLGWGRHNDDDDDDDDDGGGDDDDDDDDDGGDDDDDDSDDDDDDDPRHSRNWADNKGWLKHPRLNDVALRWRGRDEFAPVKIYWRSIQMTTKNSKNRLDSQYLVAII